MLRKTLALTVIAATLALALTGCAPSNSPTDLVRDYLQALADGDAQKVLELQPVDDADASSPLLTAEAFEGATERITNVKAENPTGSSEETADVPFSYELAGETYTGTAKLAKSEDGKWTFLAPAEGNELSISSLTFPSQDVVESFTVAGIALDPASVIEDNVSIFPGVYEVTVEIDPRFTMTQPAPVVATIDNAVYATGGGGLPDFQPTPETFADGVAAANAVLSECLANASNAQPDDCPFGHSSAGTSIDGLWESAPFAADSCEFNTSNLELTCTPDAASIVFVEPPFVAFGAQVPESRDTGDLIDVGYVVVDLLAMKAFAVS